MKEHLGGISPGVTFTNLRLEVDSYHKGDGPDVLLLRQSGDLRSSNGSLEFPKPMEGERMLVFLTREVGRVENVWARTVDRGGACSRKTTGSSRHGAMVRG